MAGRILSDTLDTTINPIDYFETHYANQYSVSQQKDISNVISSALENELNKINFELGNVYIVHNDEKKVLSNDCYAVVRNIYGNLKVDFNTYALNDNALTLNNGVFVNVEDRKSVV